MTTSVVAGVGGLGVAGQFVAVALVEEVADVEPLADVVAADVGVVDDRLAVAVGEDPALADHVGPVGDFQGLAELVVGQEDAQVVLLGEVADRVLDLADGLGVDARRTARRAGSAWAR